MSSKFFARAYAGDGAQPAQPAQEVRKSLRSVAKAKLRASKAASAAYLASAGGAAARSGQPGAVRVQPVHSGAVVRGLHARAIPPGQAGDIARAVTDGACACDAVVQPARIHVWDLPTRLFHWSLVLSVTLALATGLVGGDWMPVHGYAGIAIVGLVAFRLVWGVAGAAHARFANFAPTPGRLRAYLGGNWRGHGHNPLGALSVFALLALLAAQAGTGLVGNDEISFQGPLAQLVDEARSLQLTGLHQQLAYVLMGLIALHVLAIAAYLLVRKTNLVKPMVTGWKELPAADAAGQAGNEVQGVNAWRWTALASALGVAVLAMAFASGAGLAQDSAPPTASTASTASTTAQPQGATPVSAPVSSPAPAW